MYEVINTAVDTIENDEGSYFWWPSAGFCCGSFYSAVEVLFGCLYTAKKQLSQTNRSKPDEVCKWPCILSVNLSRISNSQV